MSSKLILILLVVIVLMGGASYAYFRYSQAEIATLHENIAKLETAVRIQEETIKAQQEAAKKQNAAMLGLQQDVMQAESQRRDLEIKLRKHDLEALARSRSGELEQKMNQATIRAFRDIEVLTGAKPQQVTPVAPVAPTAPNKPPSNAANNNKPAQSNSQPVPISAAPQKPLSGRPSNVQPPPHPPKASVHTPNGGQ